jgi:dipeptidyl aminopeptidase/acylaminoacyl peptidase
MEGQNKIFMIDPIPRLPISQPDISPDGCRILFTHTMLNKKEDKYDSHIWIVSKDTGEPRQFTYGVGEDSAPSWSPDGSDVIFLSNRGKTTDGERRRQLWIIPSCGGEARPLATVPAGIVGGQAYPTPKWSPKGDMVLFLARARVERDAQDKSDVKVIDKLHHKSDGTGFFPDTRVHLFTVGRNGGKLRQLTHGEFDVASAAWSSDGDKIAYVANLTEDTDYTPIKDIWVIPYRGGKPKKIKEGIATRGTPGVFWSPDGKKIAYTSMDPIDHRKLRHKYTNLWAMPFDGGESTNFTEDFDRPVARDARTDIKWSPDSEALYFIAPSHGCSHIYKVALASGEVERLTDGEMTVQSFSLSEDGSTIAFSATQATRLSEIWIQDTEGDRRVTSLTDGLIKDLGLVEPEEFWFTASDGAKVQGWIMKPVDFKRGERYPTILQIHGGPWTNYGYNFDFLFQLLSNNRYAVVFINHRASTGYGETFSNITGRWGEREYKDLMEAMDHTIEKYSFVDPDRLGVGGCSGGGYLTNWIVTHTNRFRAAVTVASISNWYSFYGCSDLGPSHILSFWDLAMGKEPWEDLEAYLKPSPLTYIRNVNTPLLIVHGEEDLRCPVEQAEQLYASLKKLKKTVKFIRFPGESHANVHGMKKPSHTIEALQHTVGWFDKYLKGSARSSV